MSKEAGEYQQYHANILSVKIGLTLTKLTINAYALTPTDKMGVRFASDIFLSSGTQIILTSQSVVCSEGDDAYWT